MRAGTGPWQNAVSMPTQQSKDQPQPKVANLPDPTTSEGRAFGLRELSTFLPPALVLVLVFQIATTWRTGHKELMAASLVIILTQVLPGLVVWRSVRPRAGWWVEDVALGFAIGAALAVPSQLIAVWSSATWLAGLIPLLVAAALFTMPSTRVRILSAQTRPLPWLWGLTVAGSCTLTAVAAIKAFREPVRWTGWATPYVDFPYHLALSGELAHRFPPHYPQVAGDTLLYHWFSHAWVAQVSNLSGAPLDVVLMRFMPALLAVAVPLATAALAMRISRLVWAGPLAAVIAFAVVDFDVWGFGRLTSPMAGPLSPTQGFGLLVLLPTIAVLVLRWRGESAHGSYAVLLPLLVIAGGSKGSMLPVLVAGALLASSQALLVRSPHARRVILDTVSAAVVLAVLIRFMFGGGVGGTGLAIFEPLINSRAEEFLGADAKVTGLTLVSFLTLAMLPTFMGAVGGLRILLGRDTRRDTIGWLLAGCALAGGGAIMVLDHPGFAQYYFLRTAEAPLSILAGWGTATLLAAARRPVRLAVVSAATGLLAVPLTGVWPGPLDQSDTRHFTAWASVFVFLGVVGSVALVCAGVFGRHERKQRSLAAIGVLVTAVSVAGLVPAIAGVIGPMPSPKFGVEKQPGAIHSKDVRAARWIRNHSDPDDVVMTNRHCLTGRGENCDHRRFYVAAYSERGVLLEGWAYTKKANALGAERGVSGNRVEFWDPELLELNDGFLLEPNAAEAGRLYELGVRWVYMDHSIRHSDDLAPFAQRRFRSGSVRVYELAIPEQQ